MVTDTASADGGGNRNRRRVHAAGSRRWYDLDFKLKVLNETFAPDASVAAVARRHGMNSNVLFRWRKDFRDGKLGVSVTGSGKALREPDFVEVVRVDNAGGVRMLPPPRKAGDESVKTPEPAAERKTPVTAGLIEIETPRGVRLRIEGRVDHRTLRSVLTAIRRLA
jgi:transposase